MMIKVLFLCTGNSCRSQMAEGWARHLKSDKIKAYSAGIETHGLNPYAVKVMEEVGVDISKHKSKLVTDLKEIKFDYVVTVCGHAHETCPLFPGRSKVIHVGFDDPPKLAQNVETEEEKLECYRRVRDEIKAFVGTLPESLSKQEQFMEKAKIKCPECNHVQEIEISENSCLPFYKCVGCQKVISAPNDICCVICAYSDQKCPVA